MFDHCGGFYDYGYGGCYDPFFFDPYPWMGGLYGGYGYNYCAPPVYSYPIYTQPVVQRQVIHTYPQQQQQAPTQIIITKKKEATQEPGKEKQSPSKEDGQVQAQTPPAQVVVQPSNPQVRYVQKQPRKRGCCSILRVEMTDFMTQAIDEACKGVMANDGGPFGAVIVRDGVVISRGHNMVIATNDPTAHAEITAIRNACSQVDHFNLEGCILYTSCYPCPMCMGAALWAGIRQVYYCATAEDAESVGFGDKIYHDFVKAPEQGGEMCRYELMTTPDKLIPFQIWNDKIDKIPY